MVARSSRSVACQDVQPGIGVGGRDLGDRVAERVEAAVEDQRGQQRAVVGRLGRRATAAAPRGRPGRCATAATVRR